jgi:hypothetical protein
MSPRSFRTTLAGPYLPYAACLRRIRRIENNIPESIRFFHMDALSSMVGLKVDFDLQLTLVQP